MHQAELHPVQNATSYYAEVILPLAIAKPYTYWVPEELLEEVKIGKRVEVQFGKSKLYTGLVMELHQRAPEQYQPKPIVSVIDDEPVPSERAKPVERARQGPAAKPFDVGLKDIRGSLDLADQNG